MEEPHHLPVECRLCPVPELSAVPLWAGDFDLLPLLSPDLEQCMASVSVQEAFACLKAKLQRLLKTVHAGNLLDF